MTTNYAPPRPMTTQEMWNWVRTPYDDFIVEDLLRYYVDLTNTTGYKATKVEHLRTSHYRSYMVHTKDGRKWIVRYGATSHTDQIKVLNDWYLGTASSLPTGQLREQRIAHDLHDNGAKVVVPWSWTSLEGGIEALWLPYIEGSKCAVTAEQWHETLTSIHSFVPAGELPRFTNRIKTLGRLDQLPDEISVELGRQYDRAMDRLFQVATKWSVIHGDVHAENVVNTDEGALLFDLDTTCWGPSVWDLTHLMNRAGRGWNTGYSAKRLASLFPFTDEEIGAALHLRNIASKVAREHNRWESALAGQSYGSNRR